MVDLGAQARYREDAKVLAAIGIELNSTELPSVEVRLSSALARSAVEDWQRDEDPEANDEDKEQVAFRHRAASLALIGLSILNDGRADGDQIIVDLHPGFIGDALSAADDAA